MTLYPLNRIQKGDHYIGVAIRISLKEAEKIRTFSKIKDGKKIEKSRLIEKRKIQLMAGYLRGEMKAIVKGFPTIDRLPDFYRELFDVSLHSVEMKKHLATVSWIAEQIDKLRILYLGELARCDDITQLNKIRNKFIARTDSLFKRRKSTFVFLENARLKAREFPTFKEMFTACICGYPNVGKSTLLSLITTAKPDIKPYAFTTKTLQLGYIGKEVQVIDSPGALRTDFQKMNMIEKHAFLAMKYLAECFVYVFDLSESCGYSIKDQVELFESVREMFPVKILFYFSKKDLLDKGAVEAFMKNYKGYLYFIEPESLQKELLTLAIPLTP